MSKPVAWMNDSGGCFLSDGNKYSENWIPLYTAPPKPEQEPVGIVITIGGYPDDSEHTVKLTCRHKDLKDGDLLYTAPPKPEQDLEVLKKDWVNFGYTAGRKEGYNRGYTVGREDYKQKLFGIDDE